jgi:hypothetical protein
MFIKFIKALLTTVLGVTILLPLAVIGILINLKNTIKNWTWKGFLQQTKKTCGIFFGFLTGLLNVIGIFTSVILNASAGLLIRNLYTNKLDENHLFGKLGVTTSMALGRAKKQDDLNLKGVKLTNLIEKVLLDKQHFEIAYNRYLEDAEISGFGK